MFSGIIDHCGEILEVTVIKQGIRIKIKSQFTDLQIGESIAVNGGCLTVTEFKDDLFCCELSSITLQVTIANQYEAKTRVNLERSLRLMDRIGGHLVTGHVDQTAEVKAKIFSGDFTTLEFIGISPSEKKFLIPKGSITVNGVSLTLNEITTNGFKVMIIPHTWERTNISLLEVGARVNIEFDLLSKIVANQLQHLEIISEGKIYA
jgi:riboflavin synthase